MPHFEYRAKHNTIAALSPTYLDVGDVIEWIADTENADDRALQDRYVGDWEEVQ